MRMHEWGYAYSTGVGPIGMLIIAALVAWPFWKICVKAGYPGITALLIFVPILNVIFIYWLAFSDWPSLRKTSGAA